MGLLVTRGTGTAGGTGGAEGAERARRQGPARLLALALVTVLALVLSGTFASRADAVTACAGRLAKTVPFKTGELRVFKSRAYACAVAVATKSGPGRKMSVTIQPRGGGPVVDSGTYTRQAGPVTVHALNRCVRASATIAGASGSTGWILC
ncbi:hypothetical protein [Streptomyces sp. NPDC014734]|uniref:hypothetical protein n=1 Tax=Streptomyces sp. NPDC014734 TaxID=3364886 RepID=UPI003700C28D